MRAVKFQNIASGVLTFISNWFIPLETCKLEQTKVASKEMFCDVFCHGRMFQIDHCQHSQILQFLASLSTPISFYILDFIWLYGEGRNNRVGYCWLQIGMRLSISCKYFILRLTSTRTLARHWDELPRWHLFTQCFILLEGESFWGSALSVKKFNMIVT